MQAIPQLIFNLLAQRRRVVLPGLGTLYTERQPAEWKAGTNVLSTPRIRVLFTAAEEEGETLPEVIARQSDIPLKEIKPQYHRWLAGVKKASENGEIALDGVGLLIRQPDGSYWVEVSQELDRLLNPIDVKAIRLPEQQPVKAKKERAKKKEKKERSRASRLARRAAWLASLGALLAILVYGGYFGYTRGWFDRQEPARQTPAPLAEPPHSEEVNLVLPDTMPENPVSQEADSVAPSEASPVTGEVYHLIAGVYSNRANAERYVRESVSDPAAAELIATTGGRFMVSVGRYRTKEEADRMLNELQAQYPQLWVSKRKR